jgi:hypothetical protein
MKTASALSLSFLAMVAMASAYAGRPPEVAWPGEHVTGSLATSPADGSGLLTQFFGSRRIEQAGELLKLDAPYIVLRRDGLTPLALRINIRNSNAQPIKRLYVFSGRDPKRLVGTSAIPPGATSVLVIMHLDLAGSSDLAGVVELADGTLRMTAQHVKVIVGGY